MEPRLAETPRLHALAELAEFGLVPREVLADLEQLPATGLRGSSIERLKYLPSVQAGQT
jgi:hypothetical protein